MIWKKNQDLLGRGGEAGSPSPGAATAIQGELSSCDREPIHSPGSVQPHGLMLVLDEDLAIRQISENADALLGAPAAALLGCPLEQALGEAQARALAAQLPRAPAKARPLLLGPVTAPVTGRRFLALAHRCDGGLVLELELAAAPDDAADAAHPLLDAFAGQADAAHPLLDAFAGQADEAATVTALCELTTAAVRRLTAFDRVLLYQFDEGWHGTVLAEDGSGRLPSYLHHRFPASDIPAQARELYRENRVRIIPDAGYRPVPLVPPLSPATGLPLDLSFSTLRSVSPVHVEYMRNMETAASMSISVLRGGRLWGLISCHHREPRTVPFPVRATCELIARTFSLRLSALEHSDQYERRLAVRAAFSSLLSVMADRGEVAPALAAHPRELLSFAAAQGAAVLTEGACLLVGETPGEGQVRELADWLFRDVRQEVYSTDHLAAAYPPAGAYLDKASGLLAIAVSKLHPSFVLWFRPEVVRTIRWGGDPSKPTRPAPGAEGEGDGPPRLHPRRSFETWRETVRSRSLPFERSEVEGAAELRNAIVGIVLRRAEELAALNAELARSNKELESFSYSVSHDLRAPLRHIVGYAEMLREALAAHLGAQEQRFLTTIIESSEYAGKLVDKLLGYARLGRAELQRSAVDMNLLLAEIRRDVMRDAGDRCVTWRIGDLPPVSADLMMLRMAVRDLAANALKYTRAREEALIEVGGRDDGAERVFWVRDNGVGFDMRYADKLFGVFQRLHRWEDYEGTGIGLANVRRVIERHGGRTYAEGEEGKGATFYFTLPTRPSALGQAD